MPQFGLRTVGVIRRRVACGESGNQAGVSPTSRGIASWERDAK
jgi:hypothetical protein